MMFVCDVVGVVWVMVFGVFEVSGECEFVLDFVLRRGEKLLNV